MQDLFDDQSIDWATFDRPSHDLELPNVSHVKPDYFYWPVPPPGKSWASPLDSPQEFDRGMPPLLFEGQSTVPTANCEPTESNQPTLDTSKPPATLPQEQPRQQQQRPRFPHAYSDSSALTDASSQPSLSYSHSVSSAASSNSSTSSNASHCITLCTQIITHLDTNLGDRTLGLDGVLRLSKSCVSGLLHVTNPETSQTDPNVLLLLCVALNQLSALFETNLPPATDDSSAVPTLLFGSFQVEPEDRLALGARLVGREIRRCRQLLDRIRRIHHLQRSREPDDAAAGMLQKQWFLALAGRLDRLVAAVTA